MGLKMSRDTLAKPETQLSTCSYSKNKIKNKAKVILFGKGMKKFLGGNRRGNQKDQLFLQNTHKNRRRKGLK